MRDLKRGRVLGSGTLPPLVAGVSRPGNLVMGASSERPFPPDARSVVGAFFCSRKNEQRKIPVVVGFLGVCRSRGVVEFPNCKREWARAGADAFLPKEWVAGSLRTGCRCWENS